MVTCTFSTYSFITTKSDDMIISLTVVTSRDSYFRDVSNTEFNFLFVYKIMYNNSIYRFGTSSF